MDKLLEAATKVDTVYSVLAIAIGGLYVLLWKFGGQILTSLHDNGEVAREAHSEAMAISESIQTNHGSQNLGDAVDRLTEWIMAMREEGRVSMSDLQELRQQFVLHVGESDVALDKTVRMFAEHDDRLTKLENARRAS